MAVIIPPCSGASCFAATYSVTARRVDGLHVPLHGDAEPKLIDAHGLAENRLEVSLRRRPPEYVSRLGGSERN